MAMPTGDGLRPSLINIYVFMYILLGEGGVYVIFILTYAGVRDMPPCCNTDYLLRFLGSVRQSCGREDPGGKSPSLGISLGGGGA